MDGVEEFVWGVGGGEVGEDKGIEMVWFERGKGIVGMGELGVDGKVEVDLGVDGKVGIVGVDVGEGLVEG